MTNMDVRRVQWHFESTKRCQLVHSDRQLEQCWVVCFIPEWFSNLYLLQSRDSQLPKTQSAQRTIRGTSAAYERQETRLSRGGLSPLDAEIR